MGAMREVGMAGFAMDEEFEPVPLRTTGEMGLTSTPETIIVRGTVRNEEAMAELRARPEVAGVWYDTPIAPFQFSHPHPEVKKNEAAGPCPIPPCDCDPATPKGTMADVATYLGVDKIWAAGLVLDL